MESKAMLDNGYEVIKDETGAMASAKAARRRKLIINNSQNDIYQFANNASRTLVDAPAVGPVIGYYQPESFED